MEVIFSALSLIPTQSIIYGMLTVTLLVRMTTRLLACHCRVMRSKTVAAGEQHISIRLKVFCCPYIRQNMLQHVYHCTAPRHCPGARALTPPLSSIFGTKALVDILTTIIGHLPPVLHSHNSWAISPPTHYLQHLT